jgi:RNA polymerase sigma-70 factor (ECF subfamily)
MAKRAPSDPDAAGEFVRLFAQHQRRVHAYIGTLLPNRSDADDVMQETSMVLWRKWDDFDRSRDFLRWACGIAFYEVLKHRRLRGAEKLYFSDELVRQLSVEVLAQSELHDQRREALALCMQSLNSNDRELIQHRYTTGVTARQTAADLHRPESTVYKALARIRTSLLRCVEQKIVQQGHP